MSLAEKIIMVCGHPDVRRASSITLTQQIIREKKPEQKQILKKCQFCFTIRKIEEFYQEKENYIMIDDMCHECKQITESSKRKRIEIVEIADEVDESKAAKDKEKKEKKKQDGKRKICHNCGKEKSIHKYHRYARNKKDGHLDVCIKCRGKLYPKRRKIWKGKSRLEQIQKSNPVPFQTRHHAVTTHEASTLQKKNNELEKELEQLREEKREEEKLEEIVNELNNVTDVEPENRTETQINTLQINMANPITKYMDAANETDGMVEVTSKTKDGEEIIRYYPKSFVAAQQRREDCCKILLTSADMYLKTGVD